jgi:hypothetical protein
MLNPDGYGPFTNLSYNPHYVFLAHTTETRGLPGYRSGAAAPHLTGNPKTRTMVQDVPLNRTAGSLKGWSASGGPTNHAKVHQLELITYSSKSIARTVGGLWVGDWTDDMLRWLGGIIAWWYIEWILGDGRTDVALVWKPKPCVTWACEMSFDEWWWNRQVWWCVTDHASNPDASKHWDVGALDMARAVEWAVRILGDTVPVPPTPEVPEMFCVQGDQGPIVEYWQRVIHEIDPELLPGFGADGKYGPETAAAVDTLVHPSDGKQIGPLEVVKLNKKAFGRGMSMTQIEGRLRAEVTGHLHGPIIIGEPKIT